MASEQQQQQIQPTADVVGNAFVHQYYRILHQSPELVHRFYQEVSKLGRPEAEGDMTCVTSMQAINEKILSLDYSKYKAEIKTVDAQESHNGGVFVLVTGYLTMANEAKKNFTQSFFLAPQDNGFFVLNDIFRCLEEESAHRDVPVVVQEPEQDAPPSLVQQQVPEQRELQQPEEALENNVGEVFSPSENEDGSVVDEEVPVAEVINEVPNNVQAATQSTTSTPPEEAPKKSYASIVKVMKENVAPTSAPPPAVIKQVPVKPEVPVNASQPPSSTPEAAAASIPGTTTSGSIPEAADGYSIYIKNLPMNATPAQLEAEFKRFGPIKQDGIQVRSHKQSGFCFGFVEFEVANAVQTAIEASPVTIGGKPAYCEEKRPGSRVNRGRFTPGRGGYRNDGRGQGGYGGGRGYGRGDYGRSDYGRGEYGNRGGRGARGEGGYQRVDNGGRGFNSKNVSPRVPAPA